MSDQKTVAFIVGDKKEKNLNDVVIRCFVLSSIASLSTPEDENAVKQRFFKLTPFLYSRG